MNRHEKIAWFNLAVMVCCMLLFAGVSFFMLNRYSLVYSLRMGSSVLGLGAFMAFGPMIFKGNKPADSIVDGKRDMAEAIIFDPELDERDLMIQRTARMHGFGVLWFIFILSLFGTWMWKFYQFSTNEGSRLLTITVNVMDLPVIIVGSFYLLMFVHSLSTIMQYRAEAVERDNTEISFRNCKRSLMLLGYYVVLFPILGVFMYQAGIEIMLIGLTFGFGIMNLMLWRTRTNPGAVLTDGDMWLLGRARKIVRVLLILLYVVSIVMFIPVIPDIGLHPALLIPVTFTIFTTLIILTTIYPDVRDFFRERRHEQA